VKTELKKTIRKKDPAISKFCTFSTKSKEKFLVRGRHREIFSIFELSKLICYELHGSRKSTFCGYVH
jgi:hypothetical protein